MAVGWGWATAIAQNHNVWVLCAEWQRESIESFVALNPQRFTNLRFMYVPPKPWHYMESRWFWRLCERSILKPIMHSSYRLWQRDAYAEALELHRRVRFNLAHQVTFVGFRFPGHLWKLDIPFVWGPIGGLENTPWHLLPSMGASGAVYYGARNIVNFAHKIFLRGPRKAFRHASAIIAATSGIRAEILRWYGVPSEVICEVGSPFETASEFALRAPGKPLRIAWSGRHLPGKALPILLRAMRGVEADWWLDIYGDGPCNPQWQALANRLGIDHRCTWHGQVSREEALAGLRRAHLFVTTSLKDLTSTVILEALANGIPVVCPDHCGFLDVIDESCGVKLPIDSAARFESALSRTIVELASDESKRQQLAAGALNRARDFSWEAKAEAIDRVYQRALRAAHEKKAALSERATETSAHL